MPINAGVGPFELPEAIQHQVRGSRLRIVALFTNAALRCARSRRRGGAARPDPPGSARVETSLEVRP